MDQTTQVAAAAVEHASKGFEIAPDAILAGLTWLTFFGLLWILKRFAFAPTLQALKSREDYIRKSLEDADRAQEQLKNIEDIKTQILDKAKVDAAAIIQDARNAATVVATGIEQKAKEHADSLVESANAQMAGERQRVMQELKKETVDTAIALAERVLKENLDVEKNKRLIQDAMNKDMHA